MGSVLYPYYYKRNKLVIRLKQQFKLIIKSSFIETILDGNVVSICKDKAVPVLYYAPRLEDVLGEWTYSFTHS
jgi:hypothetical protein